MEKLSSVMDINSLADEFASKIQNPAILAKCFSNNKCNLLHSAFAWKDKIHLYQEVESTNILAREALEKAIQEAPLHHHNGNLTNQGKLIHSSIFFAEQQTGGRGRQGRSFFSPQTTGLYLSLIIIPPKGVTNPSSLTATTAVAVSKALEQVYKIQPAIKWVNDIFYQGKKIGGILAEGVMDSERGMIPGAVIGIGLNIMPPEQGFPPEIDSIAGAVFPTYTPEKELNKKDLVVAIVSNLLQSLEILWSQDSKPHTNDAIMEEYRKRCLIKPGSKIKVFPLAGSTEQFYLATCLGIDHQARLQVLTEDGQQKLLGSGEVSLQSLNFTNSL